MRGLLKDADNAELVTRAALAMGIDGCYSRLMGTFYYAEAQPGTRKWWDPLTDDGDCFRMETACELKVDVGDAGVIAETAAGPECLELHEDHHFDHNATRRRASVRAVAALADEQAYQATLNQHIEQGY